MQKTSYNCISVYTFDDVSNVIVCGDIHGEFNEIVNKICVQNKIQDSVIIIAGDCGFGFNKRDYYVNMYNKNSRRLEKSNNYILCVRGNHDDPEYYNYGGLFEKKRMMCIPDYSVIEVAGRTILCIGGAVSIDRKYRIREEIRLNMHSTTKTKSVYWYSEMPVFDSMKLSDVIERFVIDTVVTHTAPSFCEKVQKTGIEEWCKFDENLSDDLDAERKTMDKIYDYLVEKKQPIRDWVYGHFHWSWNAWIDGINFTMLNINELKTLYC